MKLYVSRLSWWREKGKVSMEVITLFGLDKNP